MSERMSDSRSFEVLTASPVRLSSSPARSYRSWSEEEKARIVGRRWLLERRVGDCAVKWARSVANLRMVSKGEGLGDGCAIGRSGEQAVKVAAL